MVDPPAEVIDPGSAGMDRVLRAIGIAFLALQVLLVVHGQFSEGKHFAWAPHTTMIRMQLAVEVDDVALTERQSQRRYGLSFYPWEVHSLDNVFQLIRQYERTYGADDETRVELQYSVNGRSPRTWSWPDR